MRGRLGKKERCDGEGPTQGLCGGSFTGVTFVDFYCTHFTPLSIDINSSLCTAHV